jgi:hypothetical protein
MNEKLLETENEQNPSNRSRAIEMHAHACNTYVRRGLISLWLFLFAAQPTEFFLDVLKKLEQRSHKCVELRGEYLE